MAINLNKNREALLAAWKDVLDDKTPTDWALFGYEGLSNDLKVVSKGSDGIEELIEDLNSGQIMYAFLKVMDPKTSLPKNVLINWQGEGAPNVRKGTCANHIRDVGNFFKGAHVTITARTEEEVDSQIIIDKVSKSTGSAYSFKERSEHTSSGPVGTSYKRVIPKQEINAQERDKFWEKEEQEERQRQEEEKRRKEEERRKLEEERKRRETAEAAKREEKIIERSKSINQIREAEKATQDKKNAIRDDVVEDIEGEERERRERCDVLGRQRSEEAQQLISKRTIDARAVFERNTSAGQLNQRRGSYQPNGVQKTDYSNVSPDLSPNEPQMGRKASLPTWLPGPGETYQTETIGNKNKVVNNVNGNDQNKNHVEKKNRAVSFEEEQEWEDEVKHEIPVTNVAPVVENEQVLVNEPENVYKNEDLSDAEYLNGEYGLTARALYDYQAADATEITFDPGDIITHIDQIDEGWWQGLGPDGVFGLFPANYVELIK